MSRYILLLVAAFAMLDTSTAGHQICPLNEEWNECGSACPPTCKNPGPRYCTLQCVKGCQCKPGWLRNKLGLCIPEKWCPPRTNQTCPLNEEWNECGTACPPTCQNPGPRPCTLQCVEGCQCKPGWLRSKLGICIPKKWCPHSNQTCPSNEEWHECGTACPPTCENPRPTGCTKQCVIGCQCKPGLVRNKEGQCISENWCPNGNQTCPSNQEWYECGTACPPTCEDPRPTVCTLQCVKGCQCKPGLLRNKWGQCVPENWCPNGNQTCPLNEEWVECGTACPPTCQNPGPRPCTLQCVEGCQCKPGLLRNKWGLCVPKKWCCA